MMCLMMKKSRAGFSMVELIMVVGLMGFLFGIWMFFYPRYTSNARDQQRKADITKLKKAVEDYANDNECYPPVNVISQCGGEGLEGYLNKIPCDPQSNQPYGYQRSSNCLSFSLYANLEQDDDPSIEESDCENGCGPGGNYDYAVHGGE
jgi:type II secretory pathway pseudopilin PulG